MRFFIFYLLTQLAHAGYSSVDLPLGPNGTTATFHYFTFSSATHTLRIIDQGKPHRYNNLDAAMRANACIAGCNGGFFHKNRQPLGLVIANGRMTGTSNNKSSLTSATLYVENGTIRLVRTKIFSAKKPPLPRNVLQTGPFLIEAGKPTTGLSNRKFARRTFIATDGLGNWLLAYTPPTTLAQLAKALSKPNTIPKFNTRFAVNLDGGSSSALWVRRPNTPLYFREVRRVENFLGVIPK